MTDWRPSAKREALEARAVLLGQLRDFFEHRGVLEVETPLLCSAGVTDAAIEPFVLGLADGRRYLQTSPEYPMKRLLAAGSGDIYQICKAFRAGELGRRHNPEFTILEWYRLHTNHYQLIREVAELISTVLARKGWQIWPWQTLFKTVFDIDGLSATSGELHALAGSRLDHVPKNLDRHGLLDLLFTHCVEPVIADWGVVFVVDYPASQAALARVMVDRPIPVAARFECYVDGTELANGYWECVDSRELERRFEADNDKRKALGAETRPLDSALLAAVGSGMPECAGVALGVDRLLALQQGLASIGDAISFDWQAS
ncbi:MAG: EF-P lysine aminoacylase EpmA [Halieaceae bacterium]